MFSTRDCHIYILFLVGKLLHYHVCNCENVSQIQLFIFELSPTEGCEAGSVYV